jgi:hypothetical protein
MPKKQKRTEQEVRAMIITDAKYRLFCEDFAPEFTLREVRGSPNWEVASTRNPESWAPDCAEAFKEAVQRARRLFDIAWPL